MVDTEHVLEQMRAANPAPSLEQLAVDDLDLVRDIVARERFAMTTPVKEQPQIRPDRGTPRRGLRPVLVAGLAFVLVLGTLGAAQLVLRGRDREPAAPVTTMAPVEEPTATASSACPPGSTPDQPGPPDQPRPGAALESDGPATFDPGSGRMLVLTHEAFWMFDVCTNTWTEAPWLGEGIVGFPPAELVYDVDSDRAVSFGSFVEEDTDEGVVVVNVWAYEPATQTWTRKSDRAGGPEQDWGYGPEPEFKAVYDPVSGLVLVRETFTSQMWTYDVDTDTWTEVDQGATLPPAFAEDGPHVEVLTYDASVDRLILYVAPGGAEREIRGTWEFDIRAGRWEEQETNIHPVPGLGWPSGDEFVYDEANQVSVLFSDDTLATYNASEHRWTILQHSSDPAGEKIRSGAQMTYDPVNERILVTGTTGDGVVAFNVGTGESITLLKHTPRPWAGWYVIGGVLALAFLVLVTALAAYGRRWRDEAPPS